MSNKLLIFTSSLIITSGISGLGIMVYKNLSSETIKSKKSVVKKIKKKMTTSDNKNSSIPKLRKENKVLKIKDPDDNTKKTENLESESKITFNSEESIKIDSNLSNNFPDSSKKDINEDSEDGEEIYEYEDCPKDASEEDCEVVICEQESDVYVCYSNEGVDETIDVLKIE